MSRDYAVVCDQCGRRESVQHPKAHPVGWLRVRSRPGRYDPVRTLEFCGWVCLADYVADDKHLAADHPGLVAFRRFEPLEKAPGASTD